MPFVIYRFVRLAINFEINRGIKDIKFRFHKLIANTVTVIVIV